MIETSTEATEAGIASSLSDLERRVRRDLEILDYPRADWVKPRIAADGSQVLDVLIVGGGQGGLAVAHALMREKIRNILVIDRNPAGLEGPWLTFARMNTLRTPKHLSGPDGGIPNLTPRSWYEAQHGPGSWEKLGLLPKTDWAAYLIWFRRILGIPIRNDTLAGAVTWCETDRCFHVPATQDEKTETIRARKVVLATGIDGSGRWHVPDYISKAIPESRYSHTRYDIDFPSLKGKVVAVLGAGASAFDNASVALESGAKEVHLFFRRKELVRVNPYRWAEFVGFLKHHGEMSDELKWRFILQIREMGQLPPTDTFARATAHSNFHLHPGSSWNAVRMEGDSIRIDTTQGVHHADFIISGTGFKTDLSVRPELANVFDKIALWKDRYSPPEDQASEELSNHPYLGSHFEFTEKNPGDAPWLGDLYNYTFGCLLSLGFGGASISGMKYSVPRLVSGITRDLYLSDTDHYFKSLCEFDRLEF